MNKSAAHGFTLIELMLSVSIVAILFSAGISAYVKGQRAQAIKASAESMLVTLSSAQKKSLIGDKDCTGPLVGYEIRFTNGGDNFVTTAKCSGGVNGAAVTTEFPNVSFTGAGTITMRTLGSGVDLGGGNSLNIDFRYGGSTDTYRLIITKSGSITYEGKV